MLLPPGMQNLYFDLLKLGSKAHVGSYNRYNFDFYIIQTAYNNIILKTNNCPGKLLTDFLSKDYPEIVYHDFCSVFTNVGNIGE